MEEVLLQPSLLVLLPFDLTMLAMTLLIVGVIFGFIYWASRNMTLKPKGKQKCT